MRMCIVAVIGVGAAGCGSKAGPPSCADVAGHVLQMFGGPADDSARDVSEAFATRCTQDAWSDAVRTCIRDTGSLAEPRGCKQQMTAAQIEALDKDLAAIDTREQSRTVPASCVRYEAVLAAAEKCESFPTSAKRELRQKFDAFRATWPSVDDKRALEPTCSAAIPAVKLAAAGCPGVATW